MDTPSQIPKQRRRMLQAGALLLLFALIVGLVVDQFTVPRLGLSTHLLGVMQGLFLMLLGLVWPKLRLSTRTTKVGLWLAIYGCYSAWTANLLAAIWGAGNSMLPMAAGAARGSAFQEMVVAAALRTAALSLIATVLLVLWGLRSSPSDRADR